MDKANNLFHKDEIKWQKIEEVKVAVKETKAEEKGLTIIPLRLFINERGFAKLEIALARGKKTHDKRNTIKEKDIKRELNRIKL